MLKLGALLITAALAATVPIPRALPQQIPPAKALAVGTEKSQGSADRPDKTGKPPPLIVEARVSGKLETTADNAGRRAEAEYSKWTDPISIFTFLLVLVGAGQVWFLRNTDKATTKAAEAAN